MNALWDFGAFDAHVRGALASPRTAPPRACGAALRAATAAIERAFARGEGARVKAAFNASNLAGTPLGDDDFFYAVADGAAMMDQYGSKAALCDGLAELPPDAGDAARLANLAGVLARAGSHAAANSPETLNGSHAVAASPENLNPSSAPSRASLEPRSAPERLEPRSAPSAPRSSEPLPPGCAWGGCAWGGCARGGACESCAASCAAAWSRCDGAEPMRGGSPCRRLACCICSATFCAADSM